MESDLVNTGIGLIARALEVIGIAVIAGAFVYAMGRACRHLGQKREDAYERLKVFIGKALMLGLEFLVAADIIRTVTISPTTEGLLSLGLLVLLRIVLGWSISVEIDGCWPWEVAREKKSESGRRKPE